MANCHRCGTPLPPDAIRDVCDDCNRILEEQAAKLPPAAQDEPQMLPQPRNVITQPVVTIAIISINVLVFALMIFNGVSPTNPTTEQMVRWGADYGPLTLTDQPWRALTAAFLHVGMLHLLVNMWALWNLGDMAERLLGHTTYAVFYLLCALGGTVLSLLVKSGGVSAGASGAIFGVAGLLIALFYRGSFNVPRALIQAQMKSLLGFTLFNLIFGAIHPRINNAAHVGGMITGAVLGLLVARAMSNRERRRTAVAMAALLMTALIVGGYLTAQRLNADAIHGARAVQELESGDYPKAIENLQAAIKQRPNDAKAHAMLGWALAMNNRFDEAVQSLTRATDLDPNFVEARRTLGSVYLQQERWDDADAQFRAVLARNERDTKSLIGRGYAAAGRGRDSEAIDLFRQALVIDPRNPDLHELAADTLMRLERYSEAVSSYRAALDNGIGKRSIVEMKLRDAETSAAKASQQPEPAVQ